MNIDKDIKDLNKYISFSKKSENFSHNTDYEWHKELGEKIENVLSELETYKKIVDEIENMFSEECIKLGSYEKDNATPEKERIAGGINILNKLRKRIDWARKEVEKDV